MSISTQQAVYRVRRFRKGGDKPGKYQCTYEVIDERTQQVMAVCDLVGKAVFSTQMISDHDGRGWRMEANRKVMPSRWTVTDPGGRVAMQFDQKLAGKFTNPIYEVVLAMLDSTGSEVYRLVDPRKSIPDRVLGVGPSEWAIMDTSIDAPVAKLTLLPDQEEQPKGALGKLRNLLKSADRAIVSAGAEHVLPAPVVLGMFALFRELTDKSAG